MDFPKSIDNNGKERLSISSRSSRFHWLWLLSRDTAAICGFFIVAIVIFLGLFGPLLTRTNPLTADPYIRLLPPSIDHWLGTDTLGRDILARLLYGARVSLLVGLGTTALTTLFGGFIGVIAGYFKIIDGIIMRVMDGFMAFPNMMLALTIMAVRGPGIDNVIIAMTVSSVPGLARLVRSQVMSIRTQLYVKAAQSIGARSSRVLLKHIIPNSLSVLIIQASFTFALAIVVEAGMSFLGVGVPPEIPAWGNMLQEGAKVVSVAPWVSIFPGLAIVFIVLGLNLLGDGLRDSFDPKIMER